MMESQVMVHSQQNISGARLLKHNCVPLNRVCANVFSFAEDLVFQKVVNNIL